MKFQIQFKSTVPNLENYSDGDSTDNMLLNKLRKLAFPAKNILVFHTQKGRYKLKTVGFQKWCQKT